MQKIMNFFVGLLVGGLIGATVVILVTPASGEEIRSQIQERSIQLKDEIKAVADARRAELERELAALRAPYQSQ